MAQRRTASRSTSTRNTPKKSRSKSVRSFSLPRPVWWFIQRALPHSGAELLVLVLVLLAAFTFAAQMLSAAMKRHAPGAGVAWCAVLLSGAVAVRTSGWWRAEIAIMTRDRVRNYIGSMLLLFAALSLSGHILGDSIGASGAYLLLGALSHPPAAPVVLALLVVAGIAILLRVPVGHWIAACVEVLVDRTTSARQQRMLRTDSVEDAVRWEPAPQRFFEPELEDTEMTSPFGAGDPVVTQSRAGLASAMPDNGPQALSSAQLPGPPLPPIETFKPAPKIASAPTDLEHKALRIQETLASFNVAARVVGHHAGPAVTQFDVQPERGVKVKSITSLQNDLALALAAPSIRIQAPVPGKPFVGIEIPNSVTTTVALRELLESDAYTKLISPVAVVLGKDVAGNPAVIDLARMPHLLIAGATGSGKSVCVNAIISCLLYRNTPEDVRMMMVDPKTVELTVYNGVPHLLSPVVTQMDKVVGVLQWAIREMDRRYQVFSDNTVRNLLRFNEKMVQSGRKKLPYIVIVLDELADLMMVAPEDVEEAICRLAQKARAAGIHLVIATQRPSVDVVTGLIKANFPARIAFQMSSQIDSRTILDSSGAEKLLGSGDMLYQAPDAPKPVRLQGAFLSDGEIEKLVEFWKRSPLQAMVQPVPVEEFAAAEKEAAAEGDDLIHDAIRTVREYQTASVSLLQRRLKVGYARAARIMDQLEERGIVGPADGSKQRPVLDSGEEGSSGL